MGRSIIPIRDLTRRPPELGRIRIGAKTAKAMKALDTFRFTSSDEEALRQIAGHYGGEVVPWSDDKAAEGQYEVITDASEIRVALPADPLGGTPMYELYGGGGRERWCDGETCEQWRKGPDGPEPYDAPCICAAKGELACKPTVHLSVILPDVRGIGTWRLTTHSWNAAQEMPGMVELIRNQQAKGIIEGVLRIERKRSVQAGQTRKYPVPTLGLAKSLEELLRGEAAVGRLATATEAVAEIEAGGADDREAPALPEPPSASPAAGEGATPPASDPDDEIVEAEIVEDVPVVTAFHRAMKAAAEASGVDEDEVRHLCVRWATNGATTHWKEADHDALEGAATIAEMAAARSGWTFAARSGGGHELRKVGGGGEAARPSGGSEPASSGAPPAALVELVGDDGRKKAGALQRARRIAKERGTDQPLSFDQIPDDLAAEVAKELAA